MVPDEPFAKSVEDPPEAERQETIDQDQAALDRRDSINHFTLGLEYEKAKHILMLVTHDMERSLTDDRFVEEELKQIQDIMDQMDSKLVALWGKSVPGYACERALHLLVDIIELMHIGFVDYPRSRAVTERLNKIFGAIFKEEGIQQPFEMIIRRMKEPEQRAAATGYAMSKGPLFNRVENLYNMHSWGRDYLLGTLLMFKRLQQREMEAREEEKERLKREYDEETRRMFRNFLGT